MVAFGQIRRWIIVDVPTHPMKDADWVKTIVTIRRNRDGVVREFEETQIKHHDEDAPSGFIWEEGNYSCDCNRALFFARAGGESDDFDAECGEGAYSVNVRNPVDGLTYYKEF